MDLGLSEQRKRLVSKVRALEGARSSGACLGLVSIGGFILSAVGSIDGLKAEERRTWWLFVCLLLL